MKAFILIALLISGLHFDLEARGQSGVASSAGDKGTTVDFTFSSATAREFDPPSLLLQDHLIRSTPNASGPPNAADPECLLRSAFEDTTCVSLNTADDIDLKPVPAGGTAPTTHVEWVIFHVVIWKQGSVQESKWYLYDRHGTTRNPYFPFLHEQPSVGSGTRILGSSHVAFVPIHFGVPPSCDVGYKIVSTGKRAQNIQNVIGLIGFAGSIFGARAALPQNLMSGIVLSNLDSLPADWNISFDTSSCNAKSVARSSPPATTSKADVSKDASTSSQVYDNEGLHVWDVSVGVPLLGLKDISFNSDTGVVTPKSTDKIIPYAFFDLYPYPADIKKTDSGFIGFKFEAGIPIGNQPFNRPFFGGAITSSILGFHFAPFAGIRYQKEFRPTTLTTGTPATPGQLASNLHSVRVAKLMFGLNFSVSDAVSLFKSKTK